MGNRAQLVELGKTRPAAEAGIAGPALEARLPELPTRREHAAALAVYAHLAVAVRFAEAVRLTGHVRYPSWTEYDTERQYFLWLVSSRSKNTLCSFLLFFVCGFSILLFSLLLTEQWSFS